MRHASVLVHRWAIIAATAGTIGGAGCGVGLMGGMPVCEAETIDPELDGCFVLAADPMMGRIEIGQYECNLLTGTGEGLGDLLGARADEGWNFSGVVQAEGYARLIAHVPEAPAGVTVEAFYVSDSGEAVLRLRRPEILTPVLELIPCDGG